MARVVQKSNTRTYGFLAVVLLHVLIIWGLKAGLATSLVELIKGPMESKIIEEEKIEKVAPPPPPPKYQSLPQAAVIPVDIAVEAPTETGAATIDTSAKKRVENVATVPPRSNPRRPVSQPEYPPTSKRLGEAGTVVMLLTVDESGKVLEASIDKSSGFDRLDQAAMQEAKRAWRLLPGTIGGKPTTMQYKFAVTFKITDN
jgi:protein TonB